MKDMPCDQSERYLKREAGEVIPVNLDRHSLLTTRQLKSPSYPHLARLPLSRSSSGKARHFDDPQTVELLFPSAKHFDKSLDVQCWIDKVNRKLR